MTIRSSAAGTDPAVALGRGVAAVIRYQAAVVDREDRLEPGTGTWLVGFRGDPGQRRATARAAVLRALALAVDPERFAVLEALCGAGSVAATDLPDIVGLPRLAVAERVGDLVSAGLAAKEPDTGQVTVTPAGAALVDLVARTVRLAVEELEEER